MDISFSVNPAKSVIYHDEKPAHLYERRNMSINPETTIEISKEDLKFSAAHFTIFSATERERLHGHNFAVRVSVSAPVGENGMCFNYTELKSRIRALCRELDEYTLLPAHSPHLKIAENDGQYVVSFNDETLYFSRKDTKLLPLRNTTVEEYAHYLLSRLLQDQAFFDPDTIRAIVLKVSSGPGQWGAAEWGRN